MRPTSYIGILVFWVAAVFVISGKENSGISKEKIKENKIVFSNIEAAFKGSDLEFSFDLDYKGTVIPSGAGLHIVPVYKTNGGYVYFPEIVINSKKRAPYYKRDLKFISRENPDKKTPYVVLVQGKNKEHQVAYRIKHNISGLSKDGELYLEQQLRDGSNTFQLSIDTIAISQEKKAKYKEEKQLKKTSVTEEQKNDGEKQKSLEQEEATSSSSVKVILMDCSFDDLYSLLKASSESLIWGDLETAWQCLSRLLEKPAAYNNLGVYYWMKGDLDQARSYFEKALEAEPKTAKYNLELLDNQKIKNKQPKVSRFSK